MTKNDMESILTVYVAYRGKTLLDAERNVFVERFRDAPRDLIERAIHETAEDVGGFISLAGVAQRVAQIRDGMCYGPNVTPPHIAAMEREREEKRRKESKENGDMTQPTQPSLTPLEEHEQRHAKWRQKGIHGL